jgi:phosphoribosylaminoimidazolecarboxamide formyltransferase/IMP cyclohydrolase
MSRAILSVSDKTGIVDLAAFLVQHDYQILSTGGTAAHLREQGIPVIPISEYTRFPEILGGRVKTLHPKIFGGILLDRDDPRHRQDAESAEIEPIDVVAVNLYPFGTTVAKAEVPLGEAIEQIDIGGVSLLRAAAKNHRHVIPLCEPALYEEFRKEMQRGELSEQFRRHAARRTFELTSRYDASIARYFSSLSGGAADAALEISLARGQPMRYGENPHQRAAFYLERGQSAGFRQIHGKELSYNNLLDLDAAHRLVLEFDQPACVLIKHTNPAGAACASTLGEAARKAIESDPVSAFGGILGANRAIDAETVAAIGALFLEVIVAPEFSAEALDALRSKKNLRLVSAGDLRRDREIRSAAGGFLVQSADRVFDGEWRTVTSRPPSREETEALRFAWRVAAHVKSNAIVVARRRQTVGVGAGQMSRVDAARIALMKAVLPTKGSVAASDAFFPFRDGLDILADGGITAIVQPGGSVRDAEVIAAANERGIAMVFTGERHFRH